MSTEYHDVTMAYMDHKKSRAITTSVAAGKDKHGSYHNLNYNSRRALAQKMREGMSRIRLEMENEVCVASISPEALQGPQGDALVAQLPNVASPDSKVQRRYIRPTAEAKGELLVSYLDCTLHHNVEELLVHNDTTRISMENVIRLANLNIRMENPEEFYPTDVEALESRVQDLSISDEERRQKLVELREARTTYNERAERHGMYLMSFSELRNIDFSNYTLHL